MLVGREGQSSNAMPLKAEHLVHMHLQLSHISLGDGHSALLHLTGEGLSPSGSDRSA